MKLKIIVLAVSLMAAHGANAHEAKGPHGGLVVDAGPYHIELVASGATLDLFLTDAKEQPVPASGFKGTAILIVDGKSQRVTLEPSEGSRLTGRAAVPLPAAPKGAVLLTPPGGSPFQGKFN